MIAFFAFTCSFVTTLLVLPFLSKLGMKAGLLDMPEERKIHNVPVPLVGGIGMTAAILFWCVPFSDVSYLRGLYFGCVILLTAGILDDRGNLDCKWKFAAQACAAACLILFSKTVLVSFGDLVATGPLTLGVLAFPVTIFCAVGVINAINMMDGLDGLAGYTSFIAFLSFAVLSFLNQQPALALLSLVSAGAVLGFLRYNVQPASIFMGDAGSMTLGFTLVFLAVAVTQKEGGIVPPVASLLILAVPIVDCLASMTKRVLRSKSPFSADNGHLHHLLLMAGFTHRGAVRSIVLLCALFSCLGISSAILPVSESFMFYLFSAYFLMHLTVSFCLEDFVRTRNASRERRFGKQVLTYVKALLTGKL